MRIHSATTSKVPMPPMTTDGTVPNHAAVTPDSNSPSWFDAPMNIELTADTRPRIASGVRNWTSDCRTTTLTMSAVPSTTSAASDNANERDNPNTMVATPKTATTHATAGMWRILCLITKSRQGAETTRSISPGHVTRSGG